VKSEVSNTTLMNSKFDKTKRVDKDIEQEVHTLKEVKYIQNIGRFDTAKSVANATFGHCTLVFGENGWGKSTLADLLRLLTINNPEILIGRKTLSGGPEQKAVIRFDTQQV